MKVLSLLLSIATVQCVKLAHKVEPVMPNLMGIVSSFLQVAKDSRSEEEEVNNGFEMLEKVVGVMDSNNH